MSIRNLIAFLAFLAMSVLTPGILAVVLAVILGLWLATNLVIVRLRARLR